MGRAKVRERHVRRMGIGRGGDYIDQLRRRGVLILAPAALLVFLAASTRTRVVSSCFHSEYQSIGDQGREVRSSMYSMCVGADWLDKANRKFALLVHRQAAVNRSTD